MAGDIATIPDGTPILPVEQPAAWAIAAGHKLAIVRQRPTDHRGLVAIRATKPSQSPPWKLQELVEQAGIRNVSDLPTDAIVALVEITDVEPIPSPRIDRPWFDRIGPELDLDDFSRGGFCWRLNLVERLDPPIAYTPPAPLKHSPPPRVRGRRTGSDATRAAAAGIAPHANYLRGRVFDTIVAAGDRGATAEEVHLATGIRLATISARVNELWSVCQAITDSGKRRPTSSGRAATVWVTANQTTKPPAASVAGKQHSLFTE